MIRLMNAIAVVIAIALAVALYLAKTEAKGAQERLHHMQSQLSEERRQINVLSVEIAHLEDPERLRALARLYLGFEPLDPAREINMSDLPIIAVPAETGDGTRENLFIVRDGGEGLADIEEAGGRN